MNIKRKSKLAKAVNAAVAAVTKHSSMTDLARYSRIYEHFDKEETGYLDSAQLAKSLLALTRQVVTHRPRLGFAPSAREYWSAVRSICSKRATNFLAVACCNRNQLREHEVEYIQKVTSTGGAGIGMDEFIAIATLAEKLVNLDAQSREVISVSSKSLELQKMDARKVQHASKLFHLNTVSEDGTILIEDLEISLRCAHASGCCRFCWCSGLGPVRHATA